MSNKISFEKIKKISETNFKTKDLTKISKIDSISPPSIFIGSKLQYPLVNVGIMSPLEKTENPWLYDDEKYWAQNDLEINEVLNLRNNLLNSRFQTKTTDTRLNKKFVELSQQIALALKPVDIEIELQNRLRIKRSKDQVLTPHGMHAEIKKAKTTSNVKIHQAVDKTINDEIKASEAIEILYKKDFDEYSLNKILSVGVLGLKKNKRLVPTRWSITATDDAIGKNLLKRIRDYKIIEDHQLLFGEFMGNCYIIMIFPTIWSYELFELYLPRSSWNPSNQIKASTDIETFKGRKSYAFNTAGGYYAARLPILKYLDSIKRQATVITIRIEKPTYWASLGVWVVRETVKKAINKIMKFDSEKELIESSKKIAQIKYNFDISDILQQSILLKQIKTQKSLREWF